MQFTECNVNIYDEKKWGVLTSGCGNVLAAHSFEEAVEKAAELNKTVVDHIKPKFSSENHPIVFAQVDLWPNISDAPHDPENTDWGNAFA